MNPGTVRRMLIIGYGNTLRGDDGAGWLAAEQLRAAGQPPHVSVLTCHQLTLDLVIELANTDAVLFLDAHMADTTSLPAGSIEEAMLAPDDASPGPLEHHVSPTTLLAAAQALNGRCPAAVLLTLRARTFDAGEGLSPAVSAALPRFAAHAQDIVARWQAPVSGR